MSAPIILVPRACNVSEADITALRAAGVVVVACDKPQLIRPLTPDADALLTLMRDAAVSVCRADPYKEKFGREVLLRLLKMEEQQAVKP